MSNESILILESDPALERQLNEVLSSVGFLVYAAERVDALLRALESAAFPVILIDLTAPDVDPAKLAAEIISVHPDTHVIFTGNGANAALLLEMIRGGGADFVAKPFEPSELIGRVKANIERRNKRRARLRLWKRRAQTAESALKDVRETSGVGGASSSRAGVGEFAEFSLQTFLEMERRNLLLERQIEEVTNPDSKSERTAPIGWVAHEQPDFSQGVLGIGERVGIRFRNPLNTGGEVLDKAASTGAQIVVLGETFPDIPFEMVVETLAAQNSDTQLVVVSGWGTSERSCTLFGGSAGPEVVRKMETVDDLIAILDEARGRCVESELGKEFAGKFKQRHDDFLRRYAEIRQRSGG